MLNHHNKMAVALMLFCVHAATAYPTPMERVPGDNNYLALRNSPSRDLDRFIDSCGDDDDEQCGGGAAPIAVATVRDGPVRLNGVGHAVVTKRSSLDRLNGGHTLVAKRDSLDRLSGDFIGYVAADECDGGDGCDHRSNAAAAKRSLDRLNGGHTMVAKRGSLDRLNGGHTMVAKRGSLDRLNGDFISFADECDGSDGCDASSNLAAAAKRISLDRLNGGHTMVAKRGSLDRLNGGHTMVAKRGSLDRLNGDVISFADECDGSDGCDASSNLAAAVKRISVDRLNGGHTMAAKRGRPDLLHGSTEGGYGDRWWSGRLRDTIDRLGAGGPLSVHRWSPSSRQTAERDVEPRPRTWTNEAAWQYVDRGCVGCAPVIKSSSY